MFSTHRSILYLCLFKCTIVSCLLTTQFRPQRHASYRALTVALKSQVSNEINTLQGVEKSPESGFWWAAPQTSSEHYLPAINGIERETGPLPPGAYQTESNICLIGVNIRPPLSSKEGEDILTVGTKHCQKMIDSGLNSFSVGKTHCDSSNNISQQKTHHDRITERYVVATNELKRQYTARTMERHEFESHFYRTLRRNTPSSVLRSCHFAIDFEIPSVLHVTDVTSKSSKSTPSVPYGNGWVVRKSISDALLRLKTECLDSVNLEYNPNSSYHLDTLNTLSEMKVEGLIKSISTKGFPSSLLQSASECGFNIYTNNQNGNLLHIGNLNSMTTEHKPLISAPLAGGLLTNSISLKEDIRQLTQLEKKLFDVCCMCPSVGRTEKWNTYRNIIDTIRDVSFRYKVSTESVALRWLLQIDSSNAILVSTRLGMDLSEEKGGVPFKRHGELRQVFGFSLEEEDMEKLNAVAGFSKDGRLTSALESGTSQGFIDFNDKSLWL